MIIKAIKLRTKLVIVTGFCIMLCIALLLFIFGLLKTDSTISDQAYLNDQLQKSALDNSNALTAFLTVAQEPRMIEIFDVKSEKVVKKVSMETAYQKTAEKYLNSISGIYVKVNAFPKSGFIVRIPLEPAVQVNNPWLKEKVTELFVIFPEEEKPYLLVLDFKYRPLFYKFGSSTEELLNSLNYKPEPQPQVTVSPNIH